MEQSTTSAAPQIHIGGKQFRKHIFVSLFVLMNAFFSSIGLIYILENIQRTLIMVGLANFMTLFLSSIVLISWILQVRSRTHGKYNFIELTVDEQSIRGCGNIIEDGNSNAVRTEEFEHKWEDIIDIHYSFFGDFQVTTKDKVTHTYDLKFLLPASGLKEVINYYTSKQNVADSTNLHIPTERPRYYIGTPKYLLKMAVRTFIFMLLTTICISFKAGVTSDMIEFIPAIFTVIFILIYVPMICILYLVRKSHTNGKYTWSPALGMNEYEIFGCDERYCMFCFKWNEISSISVSWGRLVITLTNGATNTYNMRSLLPSIGFKSNLKEYAGSRYRS